MAHELNQDQLQQVSTRSPPGVELIEPHVRAKQRTENRPHRRCSLVSTRQWLGGLRAPAAPCSAPKQFTPEVTRRGVRVPAVGIGARWPRVCRRCCTRTVGPCCA
jgi:hypothetical protein